MEKTIERIYDLTDEQIVELSEEQILLYIDKELAIEKYHLLLCHGSMRKNRRWRIQDKGEV